MSQSALGKINQSVVAVAAVYNRQVENDFNAHRTPLTKQLLKKSSTRDKRTSVHFDSLAPALLALWANLHLVYLKPALAFGCVLCGYSL